MRTSLNVTRSSYSHRITPLIDIAASHLNTVIFRRGDALMTSTRQYMTCHHNHTTLSAKFAADN